MILNMQTGYITWS